MRGSLLLMSIGLLSLIAALAYMRTFLSVLPNILACIFRSKECINLEDSVSLARERNIIYCILLPTAAIFVSYHNLLCLDFLEPLGPEMRLAAVCGLLLGYAGLRTVLTLCMSPRGLNDKIRTAWSHSFRNFTILDILFCLACGGILNLLGFPAETVRFASLGITAACYFLFLIRKMQIFASVRSLFSSILYLCGLEILPSGLLVAAGFVF